MARMTDRVAVSACRTSSSDSLVENIAYMNAGSTTFGSSA
ncbi:Uncharacterised protein [Mycobacteroides abscessus subsp. abscessus]|nr:Uncharacterised protein [Mycobacteroides abscessus subsp. abscessus]